MTTSDSDPNPPVVRGSVNRRDFLKKSGGASVATMLALHGTKSDVMASGTAYVGIYCQNPLPTGASSSLSYGTNTSGSGSAYFLNSPAPTLWASGRVKSGKVAGTSTSPMEIKYNPLLTVPVAPGELCNFDPTGFLNGGWVALGGDKDLGMADQANLLLRRCDKAWFKDGWCWKVMFTYDTFVNTAAGVGFDATGGTEVEVRPGDGWTSEVIIPGSAGFVPEYNFTTSQTLTVYIGPSPSTTPKKVSFSGVVKFDKATGFVDEGQIASGYADLLYAYDGTNYHYARVKGYASFTQAALSSGHLGRLISATSAVAQTLRKGPPPAPGQPDTNAVSVAINEIVHFHPTTGWLQIT